MKFNKLNYGKVVEGKCWNNNVIFNEGKLMIIYGYLID